MLAAVDLGSNSFRLHIGIHDGENIRVIKSAREPIRLGAGLDRNGDLTAQAMQNALACLSRFAEVLHATPLSSVRVVATNTLRIARNAATFLPLAEKAIGHPIEIISGEEEGRLIYMGVACFLNQANERRLVVDIGGGSTELALGKGSTIEKVESFSIGTVSTSAPFFADERLTDTAFEAAILSARSHFEDGVAHFESRYFDVVYGSSGTMRTLAELIEKNKLGDGTLSARNLKALKERLIACGKISKIDLIGMKPERIGVTLGGLPVLIGLCQELGLRSLQPIEAGLRMGVLWDLHMRASHQDRRDQSVSECMQRFDVDGKRARQVLRYATALYKQMKPESEHYDRLLGWGAQLHEVGLAISHTGFHKHGAYLAEHADLPGFTTHEQQVLSTLILAQKGNLRKVQQELAEADLAKAVLSLRLAIIFMHARLDPMTERVRLRIKSRIELEMNKKTMTDHPTLFYWLTKEQGAWQEIGLEFAILAN